MRPAQVVGEASCFDEALRPHTVPGEIDHFVEVFADKIPHTHGAPVRPAVPVTG